MIPFVQGNKILEIGHGPGYLQRLLRDQNFSAIGIDESMQMIHRAKHRLEKADDKTINLTRGLAQALPFPDAQFDPVISTFPSDYIFNPNTLSDIYRVLRDDGHFIVLPAAWIVGRKFHRSSRGVVVSNHRRNAKEYHRDRYGEIYPST